MITIILSIYWSFTQLAMVTEKATRKKILQINATLDKNKSLCMNDWVLILKVKNRITLAAKYY